MSGPYVGAFTLSESRLKAIKLPVNDLIIHQDNRFQPVTTASAELVQAVLEHHPEQNLTVLELGSGCGIVSIMLALNRPKWRITGLEIQKEEVQLSMANALGCGLEIEFLEADIRTWTAARKYDLIVSNPPWQPLDSGRKSPIITRAIGRQEIHCNTGDVIRFIEGNLAPGGEGLVIYPRDKDAHFGREIAKSSLDKFETCSSRDTDKYLIYRIRHRG